MNTHEDKLSRPANRLIQEKSFYLRQHAFNPVEWYPWSDEAFEKARKEDKIIFLSIGYSACHWCHVMAHESFENDSIAAYMNEHFVNIKVDREEYPDVDHLYQSYVQMTTGRGGWPLSVFLTPEGVPFFGGTYFPDKPRHGMISFPELLRKIVEIKENDYSKIKAHTSEITQILRQINQFKAGENLPDPEKTITNLFQTLSQNYDEQNGGFGNAPKFPHTADLEFLLSFYHHTGNPQARVMVLTTLKKMAEGGIYDHLGGGFHRYSTDAKWLVPHFEKMLYDNALLIPLYADAYRLTGEEFFRRIACQTADFVLQELRDPRGGFYSTLDADSEGEEGKYYLWDYREIKEALPADALTLFGEYYNIVPSGHYEGKNILHVTRPLEQLAKNHGMTPEQFLSILDKARNRLREIRRKRVRPGLDDKILTDWNGMMISALWNVYQISGQDKYRQAAREAIQFIQEYHLKETGQLAHFAKSKKHLIPGYLDDYAYFIRSLIDGYETTQNIDYFKLALKLTEKVLQEFQDKNSGGFYFKSIQADTLITPLSQVFDSSTPAGNSIMVLNLLRLHQYTGKKKLNKAAEDVFKVLREEMENRGAGMSSLVRAFSFYYYTPLEITLSIKDKESGQKLLDFFLRRFLPDKILLVTQASQKPDIFDPALIEGRQSAEMTAAFLCLRNTCSLPIHQPEKAEEIFSQFQLHTH